jgi:AhpD family alkylhydroperoxidase
MTTATSTQIPVRLDFDAHAAVFSRALTHLDNAATKELDRTGIDHRLRELLRLRVSQLNGCAYCVDMHSQDALRGGDSELRVHGVVAWRHAPYYTAQERAALALTEAITLIADGVPDDVWAEAERHFESAELAALVWAIVVINAWNRLAVPTGDPVPGTYAPS